MKKIRVVVTIIAVLVAGFLAGRSFWNKLEREEQADSIATSQGCGRDDKKESLDGIKKYGCGMRYMGCAECVVSATNKFLGCGFNIHEKDDFLLRMAARCGDNDAVHSLLGAGANVHAKNDEALRYAVAGRNYEIANMLLEAGANPRVRGNEPLLWAIRWNNPKLVERLLEAGAKPDRRALDLAFKLGRDDIAKMLVKVARNNP